METGCNLIPEERMITGFTHTEYNGIFYDAGCAL